MTRLDENALLRSQLAELEVSLQALKEENAMLRDERRIDNEDLAQEVERLRAQRVLSNEDFARSFDMGLAAGERRERAAVVAYLREQAEQWDRDAAGWAAMNHASVMIERGLHRREEGA